MNVHIREDVHPLVVVSRWRHLYWWQITT